MDTTQASYNGLLERPKNIKKGLYMYMVRIYVKNVFSDDFGSDSCYKIGYTEINSHRNDIDFRMNELNQEFDCCSGIDPANILLVFLIPIDLPSIEKNFHRIHKKYNISANKVYGKKSKECYKISPEFYDIFKAYADEHLIRKYWESKNYVISDTCEESFIFKNKEYNLN